MTEGEKLLGEVGEGGGGGDRSQRYQYNCYTSMKEGETCKDLGVLRR